MVYLLSFHEPIGRGKKHVQFYLGWCEDSDFDKRIKTHRKGKGSRLTQVAKERNVGFSVVRTWPGYSRGDERRLKNRKNHRLLAMEKTTCQFKT